MFWSSSQSVSGEQLEELDCGCYRLHQVSTVYSSICVCLLITVKRLIQAPASIGTSDLDPQLVLETWLLFETQLVLKHCHLAILNFFCVHTVYSISNMKKSNECIYISFCQNSMPVGVSKSTECDIFPSVLWHCWLGDRKGIWPVKTGCWFVGGDDLTGALHDLPYSSSSPVVTTTSIILCFNKHRLT